MKLLVTSLIAVPLFFSFSTVHAFSKVEVSQPEQTKTIVQDLYTADGEPLGKVRKKLTIQVQRLNNGVELKVTEDNNYDLKSKFISKVIRRGSYYFDSAKSVVDSFQNNVQNYRRAWLVFDATLAAEGLTIRTANIPLILAGSIALTTEAAIITTYFNDARDNIRRAYNYISAA